MRDHSFVWSTGFTTLSRYTKKGLLLHSINIVYILFAVIFLICVSYLYLLIQKPLPLFIRGDTWWSCTRSQYLHHHPPLLYLSFTTSVAIQNISSHSFNHLSLNTTPGIQTITHLSNTHPPSIYHLVYQNNSPKSCNHSKKVTHSHRPVRNRLWLNI